MCRACGEEEVGVGERDGERCGCAGLGWVGLGQDEFADEVRARGGGRE